MKKFPIVSSTTRRKLNSLARFVSLETRRRKGEEVRGEIKLKEGEGRVKNRVERGKKEEGNRK